MKTLHYFSKEVKIQPKDVILVQDVILSRFGFGSATLYSMVNDNEIIVGSRDSELLLNKNMEEEKK